MNKNKVIQGLRLILEGLEADNVAMNKEETLPINFADNSILATRLANSYQTYHAERGVKSLVKDLNYMADNEDKVGFLISWLRKNSVEGIEEFFKKNKKEQQTLIQAALKDNEDLITNILTKRFG